MHQQACGGGVASEPSLFPGRRGRWLGSMPEAEPFAAYIDNESPTGRVGFGFGLQGAISSRPQTRVPSSAVSSTAAARQPSPGAAVGGLGAEELGRDGPEGAVAVAQPRMNV